ncbi:MAG: serine/threonine kinase PknH [Mycobacterium sp.]|nr:serine/threonine kinase PknH [Mycobacterium sp.]
MQIRASVRSHAIIMLSVTLLVGSTACASSTVIQGDRRSTATPSSGRPTPETGGLFSGEQPWTTDVSSVKRSDRSDSIIATLTRLGGWGNDNVFQTDFSIPIFFADEATPRAQVIGIDGYCYGGPDCDEVPAQIPVPANANMEGSEDLSCDVSQQDCHLLVVDRNDDKLYEVYQGNKEGDDVTAMGLFVWDLGKSYPETLRGDQCTSADAAGFPIAGLTPTADEVAAGGVDHALRFILPNDRMKADVYVRPATHAGGPESTDPNAPPYGVRLRLKSDFDDSGFGASQKVILAALKKYGMFLSDGGEIALTFADDRTSIAKWADLGIDSGSFSAIPPDAFEVVELGADVPLTYDCVRNP